MAIDPIKVAFNKSQATPCKFKVCVIAYDRRGRLLGVSYCIPRFHHKGGGIHAEMMALHNWGTRIYSMTLLRFGKNGNFLPIHPCPNCQKVLTKLKIKIHTLHEE
jgi:pyrimidine deaminase RibD-like protein